VGFILKTSMKMKVLIYLFGSLLR